MYAKLFEDRIFVMILIVILFRQLYKIDSFGTADKEKSAYSAEQTEMQ